MRVGLPVLAYALLYPIILERSGLEVLGLWSLIASLTAVVGLANFGFATLMIRSVSAAGSDPDLGEIARDQAVAIRFYVAVTAVVLAIWLVVAGPLLDHTGVRAVYGTGPLVAAVALQIVTLGISITAQLDSAVLIGSHQTYAVHTIDAFSPLIRYLVALGGAVWAQPIEGFVLGAFLATVLQFVAYRLRLRRQVPAWRLQSRRVPLGETIPRCLALMRRSAHFYTISIGYVVREPVFRTVIAHALGLKAVGVYEIASRIPATIRELTAVGASSLLPAFSHFHARGSSDQLHRLIRQGLIVLMACTHTALLTYALGAPPFLALWLPAVPADLVTATRIATTFWAITVVNIPFWYLLQANGNEKAAAASLWSHTIAIVLLYPMAMMVTFSLAAMLWYWVATSILTQLAIFAAAERSAGAVRPTLLSRPLMALVVRLILMAMVLGAVTWGSRVFALGPWPTLGVLIVAAAATFFVLLFPVVQPILRELLAGPGNSAVSS